MNNGGFIFLAKAVLFLILMLLLFLLEYWYIFFGIPAVALLVYIIWNFKSIQAETEKQLDEYEKEMKEKYGEDF